MSAGSFNNSRYQASYAVETHPIRVQPETEELFLVSSPSTANSPVTTAITNPISATISRGRRGRGLIPRAVTIRLRSTATPPSGYDANTVVRLPILTESFYNQLPVGTFVNYLDAEWTVVGRSPELAR